MTSQIRNTCGNKGLLKKAMKMVVGVNFRAGDNSLGWSGSGIEKLPGNKQSTIKNYQL